MLQHLALNYLWGRVDSNIIWGFRAPCFIGCGFEEFAG